MNIYYYIDIHTLLVNKSLFHRKFQFDNENFKKPSSTLFVVNFDPLQTKESDLKEHFETFGKTSKITIRNNVCCISRI